MLNVPECRRLRRLRRLPLEDDEFVACAAGRHVGERSGSQLGIGALGLVHRGEAVDLGIICDAVFVFVKFSREPTFEDYADHLLKNERHGAVLACFNRQWRAREFARVYNEKRPTGSQPAESYVSGDPRESLDRFRDGATRVLCVVTRVELGVNVHVCDTVLMVDPWDSNS